MLCGVVVLRSCACIWISCSSRLLPNEFEGPDVELSDEPVLDVPVLLEDDELPGAVVIETLEPSEKSIAVVEVPLLFVVVWVVAPLLEESSICSRDSIPPPPP